MQKRLRLNKGLIILLIAAFSAGAVYHTDLVGHVAYALERGKLQADIEHLAGIEAADIASLEQLSHAFSVVSDVVRPSVVNVEARSTVDVPNEELLRLFKERGIPIPPHIDRGIPLPPKRGTGSGIVLDNEGHIITNNHVVADAEVIQVTLADGREYRGEVVGTDPMTDLAVVKISADRLHPARFGDSDRMKVGHIVLAIGSPFRLEHSLSHGIISALGRGETMDVDIDYKNWLQTDAPINPGNSGGPLINIRGEVIGINTAIATESGGHQGVGFAIPSNVVTRVAEVLRTGEAFERGYLGVVIKPVSPKVADAYGLEEPGGVFVNNVGDASPAAKAGLKPEDIILAIDDKEIGTREQLQEMIAATPPGTKVDMTVWRDGAERHVTVRIGHQPTGFSTTGSIRDLDRWLDDADDDEQAPDGETDADTDTAAETSAGDDADSETEVDFDALGFSADTVSPALKKAYELDRGIQNGALITWVSPTGEAFASGLRPGHVIAKADGKRINNIRELRQVLTDKVIAKGVRLKIKRTITLEARGKVVHDTDIFYTVLRVR